MDERVLQTGARALQAREIVIRGASGLPLVEHADAVVGSKTPSRVIRISGLGNGQCLR
jgi:hypothetical protein